MTLFQNEFSEKVVSAIRQFGKTGKLNIKNYIPDNIYRTITDQTDRSPDKCSISNIATQNLTSVFEVTQNILERERERSLYEDIKPQRLNLQVKMFSVGTM